MMVERQPVILRLGLLQVGDEEKQNEQARQRQIETSIIEFTMETKIQMYAIVISILTFKASLT